jgi:hypothetical protein
MTDTINRSSPATPWGRLFVELLALCIGLTFLVIGHFLALKFLPWYPKSEFSAFGVPPGVCIFFFALFAWISYRRDGSLVPSVLFFIIGCALTIPIYVLAMAITWSFAGGGI